MDIPAIRNAIAEKTSDPDLLLDIQKHAIERLRSTPRTYAPTHNPTDEEALAALNDLENLGNVEEQNNVEEAEARPLFLIMKWSMNRMTQNYL